MESATILDMSTLIVIVFIFIISLLIATSLEYFTGREAKEEERSERRDLMVREELVDRGIARRQIAQLESLVESLIEGMPVHYQPEEIPRRPQFKDTLCPQCKRGRVVQRSGPYSSFMGCSNYYSGVSRSYPSCDYRNSIIQEMERRKIDKKRLQEDYNREVEESFMEDFRKAYQ